MERSGRCWPIGVAGLVFALVLGPEAQAASGKGSGGGGDLLFLVTEKTERAGADRPEADYWWSNPSEPQWTGTDRALQESLAEADIETLEPAGNVRISRIYRTPDLSLDNAASLASILDARRIVVGEVVYRPIDGEVLPDSRGMQVDGELRVVDVASSDPTVIRTLDVERSVFASADAGEGKGAGAAGPGGLRERAERRFASAVSGLLERTVAAAAGAIGVDSSERLLAFRDLRYGRALKLVREFLGDLDTVSATRVRWGAEGRIALELNPGTRDARKEVDYAARTLVEHDFEQMSIGRPREGGSKEGRVELTVNLSKNFEPTRRRDEDRRNDE